MSSPKFKDHGSIKYRVDLICYGMWYYSNIFLAEY
jgi:hypothetical protein